MGIQIEWDNTEKTVVRWDFQGRWTLDDMRAAVDQSTALRRSVPHATTIILNLEGSQAIPLGVLPQMVVAMNTYPYKRRGVIVAGGGVLAQNIVRVYSSLRHHPTEDFLIVDSLAEARACCNPRMDD